MGEEGSRSGPSREEWLQAVNENDCEHLDRLLERLIGPVTVTATQLASKYKRLRGHVEDIVAETLFRAYQKRFQYEGRNNASPATWCCQIARTTAIDKLRRLISSKDALDRAVRATDISADEQAGILDRKTDQDLPRRCETELEVHQRVKQLSRELNLSANQQKVLEIETDPDNIGLGPAEKAQKAGMTRVNYRQTKRRALDRLGGSE